jgi:hypothetical protein
MKITNIKRTAVAPITICYEKVSATMEIIAKSEKPSCTTEQEKKIFF